jgi:hypothetical protein
MTIQEIQIINARGTAVPGKTYSAFDGRIMRYWKGTTEHRLQEISANEANQTGTGNNIVIQVADQVQITDIDGNPVEVSDDNELLVTGPLTAEELRELPIQVEVTGTNYDTERRVQEELLLVNSANLVQSAITGERYNANRDFKEIR